MKYLIFLLLLASCVLPDRVDYLERQNDTIKNIIYSLQTAQATNNSRFDKLESNKDSAQEEFKWVAKTLYKHDSCIFDRQWKRDRAMRRSIFWGGLINAIVK